MLHCISVRHIDDLFQDDDAASDRTEIASKIIEVYARYPWKDGLIFSQRALEYSRKALGDENPRTCELSWQLAEIFNRLSQYEKALNILQGKVDVSRRSAGPDALVTLNIMVILSGTYRNLGRSQEALELGEEVIRICENSVGGRDDVYLFAMDEVAQAYIDLGRYQKAVDILEVALLRAEASKTGSRNVLNLEDSLAHAYAELERHQDSLECLQRLLENRKKALGEDHPNTLTVITNIAVTYGNLGQPEKGIPFIIQALEIGSRIGLDTERLQRWENNLKWLESLKASLSSTKSRTLFNSQDFSHPEPDELSSRRRWKFWPKHRHRLEEPSSSSSS